MLKIGACGKTKERRTFMSGTTLIAQRKCLQCGQTKSIRDFYGHRKGITSNASCCKMCYRNVPEGYKRCSNCYEVKSFDAFYASSKVKDRVGFECKECNKDRYHRKS